MPNFAFIDTQTRLSAGNGSYLISGSVTATNLYRYSFIPQEDTIVTMLSGSDVNMNSIDLMPILNISGKVLKQNSLHCVGNNYNITSISLVSGSVILY